MVERVVTDYITRPVAELVPDLPMYVNTWFVLIHHFYAPSWVDPMHVKTCTYHFYVPALAKSLKAPSVYFSPLAHRCRNPRDLVVQVCFCLVLLWV